ncbi:MAG TPA: S8 family serine peptidase, partial [Actinomycetota bacterium]|nr:S8 family serine peptidase [Actinomycetota bacterium]
PPACAHGTEVASVVAANDDDSGTIGVAPDATVVSYRVDDPDDPECGIPISFLVAALRGIAADDEVDVVNMSLGGSQWSEFEEGAIEAVLDAGKVVVASAGNNGDRMPQYPAAFPGVISVGATDEQGQIAEFSSYGKVDVVAPGVCVAVAEVADTQQQVCGGRQSGPGVAFASGTSFAAPIVSGLLALAESRSPLLARLALAATADGDHPDGEADVKQWAHGLADADAFVAAHRSGAPPALVLETSSQRLGSGDGQLPHPDTTYVAYAFQAAQLLAANPGAASFAVAEPGTPDIEAVPFEAVPGEPGTFRAVLATGPLDPGLQEEIASATIQGEATTDSVPVLVLEPDDQAPGVPLVGSGDDAWRRVDSVDGLDLDDVYAVTLDAGDRLDVAFASRSSVPVAALLLKPGTVDVYGQLQEQVVACGGGAGAGCPRGLHHRARSSGTYLLDVFSSDPTGPAADYRLTWTVRAADGPPVQASVPACSPNGDGVKDRCAWTAGAVSGWTTTSFVTMGSSLVERQAGAGPHTWDGRDEDGIERDPGRYRLRVLSTQADGRAQLRAVMLTLDQKPPSIATATASPNPFEPRPHDGDRDTTTFAMTSSEPGRLRVIIYRYASTTVVRVLVSGSQAAGRQVVGWSGRTSSGAWLRGRYSYVAEAVDAAGNASRSRRHYVKVLSAGRK